MKDKLKKIIYYVLYVIDLFGIASLSVTISVGGLLLVRELIEFSIKYNINFDNVKMIAILMMSGIIYILLMMPFYSANKKFGFANIFKNKLCNKNKE